MNQPDYVSAYLAAFNAANPKPHSGVPKFLEVKNGWVYFSHGLQKRMPFRRSDIIEMTATLLARVNFQRS